MMRAHSLTEVLDHLAEEWKYRSDGPPWKLYGFLFCRPDLPGVGPAILKAIAYYHHRSGLHIDFFFPGFTERWYCSDETAHEISAPDGSTWWYSPRDFNEWRKDLEQLSDWVCSGSNELLLVKIGTGRHRDRPSIDFDNALAITLDGIADGDSVSALFERIFKYAEKQDEENPIFGFSDREGLRLGRLMRCETCCLPVFLCQSGGDSRRGSAMP